MKAIMAGDEISKDVRIRLNSETLTAYVSTCVGMLISAFLKLFVVRRSTFAIPR